jgi:hypothetical protein
MAGKDKGKDIEVLKGKTNPNILLIAPHGHSKDDANTGALVRSIQKILDCPAIINEVFRKPADKDNKTNIPEEPNPDKFILDLNLKDQAEQYPKYLRAIEKRIKNPESTFVFWIHGILDANLKKEAEAQNKKDSLECLLGYGQGHPEKPTCKPSAIMGLIGALNSAGLKSAATSDKTPDYRGWDTGRMNQYFRVSGNGFKDVQSVQLEFGFKGIRDKGSIKKTAEKFSRALVALNGTMKINPVEDKVDEKLVSETLDHLSRLFNGGYQEATLQAGDYIIEKFFGGDPQLVIDKRPVLKKSISSLIRQLKEGADKSPSKSWFFNAYHLAAYEQIFKKSGFQIFGNLGHSHKLALLHVKKIEKIKELADEAVKKKYNVAQLKEKAKEVRNDIKKANKTKSITLKNVQKKEDLKGATRKKLEGLEKQAKKKIKLYENDLEDFKKRLALITEAIKALPTKSKKTKKVAKSANVVNIENGRKKRDAKKAVDSKAEPKKAKGA